MTQCWADVACAIGIARWGVAREQVAYAEGYIGAVPYLGLVKVRVALLPSAPGCAADSTEKFHGEWPRVIYLWLELRAGASPDHGFCGVGARGRAGETTDPSVLAYLELR